MTEINKKAIGANVNTDLHQGANGGYMGAERDSGSVAAYGWSLIKQK